MAMACASGPREREGGGLTPRRSRFRGRTYPASDVDRGT